MSSRDYRYINFDNRGIGESTGDTRALSVDALARDAVVRRGKDHGQVVWKGQLRETKGPAPNRRAHLGARFLREMQLPRVARLMFLEPMSLRVAFGSLELMQACDCDRLALEVAVAAIREEMLHMVESILAVLLARSRPRSQLDAETMFPER